MDRGCTSWKWNALPRLSRALPLCSPCHLYLSYDRISTSACRSETLGYFFHSVWHMKNSPKTKCGAWSPKVLADVLRAISWLHGRHAGHLHGWPWSLTLQAGRSHSAVTVQHGPHLAPLAGGAHGRAVTGGDASSPENQPLSALRLAARNRRENTPARHVPAGPGPSTATAAETSDFPVQDGNLFLSGQGASFFYRFRVVLLRPAYSL